MTASPDDRRGLVGTDPDGGRRLVFRRSWPGPAADVWAALTEPERTARWIGRYEGGRGAGAEGAFTMSVEEGAPTEPVRIAECDPPWRLVLEWLDESRWRVELDLTEADGTTTLAFTQVLPAGTGVADVAAGWHWYLDRLDAVLTGADGPVDWESFYAAVGPGYVGA